MAETILPTGRVCYGTCLCSAGKLPRIYMLMRNGCTERSTAGMLAYLNRTSMRRLPISSCNRITIADIIGSLLVEVGFIIF